MPMRVLVIEDEMDLRDLLVEEIQDLGYEVAQAANGEEGLDMVRQCRPDVICSDINMPGLSGLDLRLALDQENLVDDATVFIFISANSTRTDIADGLMAGASHYFTKPVDYDRLTLVLAEAAEQLSATH